MTNYHTGHMAEQRAAGFLKERGFEVLNINWRTRYCEIDIVAQHKNTIYFVEVKYRRSNRQGQGMDYITSKKLNQMRFAAEIWVSQHKWRKDYQLAVISIDGEEITFIDQIDP